jgi:hypothetical protein
MGHVVNEVIFYFRYLFLLKDAVYDEYKSSGYDQEKYNGKKCPAKNSRKDVLSLIREKNGEMNVFFFPDTRQACFVCFRFAGFVKTSGGIDDLIVS